MSFHHFSFLLRLPSSLEKVEGDLLFLQSKITEVLGGSGYNTDRLATPYVPQYTGNKPRKYLYNVTHNNTRDVEKSNRESLRINYILLSLSK